MADQENGGWGRDFDDEGNVVGEVPNSTGGFFDRYRYHLLGVWVVWLLVSAPRLFAQTGDASIIGVVAGAMIGSALFAILAVGVYHTLGRRLWSVLAR